MASRSGPRAAMAASISPTVARANGLLSPEGSMASCYHPALRPSLWTPSPRVWKMEGNEVSGRAPGAASSGHGRAAVDRMGHLADAPERLSRMPEGDGGAPAQGRAGQAGADPPGGGRHAGRSAGPGGDGYRHLPARGWPSRLPIDLPSFSLLSTGRAVRERGARRSRAHARGRGAHAPRRAAPRPGAARAGPRASGGDAATTGAGLDASATAAAAGPAAEDRRRDSPREGAGEGAGGERSSPGIGGRADAHPGRAYDGEDRAARSRVDAHPKWAGAGGVPVRLGVFGVALQVLAHRFHQQAEGFLLSAAGHGHVRVGHRGGPVEAAVFLDDLDLEPHAGVPREDVRGRSARNR